MPNLFLPLGAKITKKCFKKYTYDIIILSIGNIIFERDQQIIPCMLSSKRMHGFLENNA